MRDQSAVQEMFKGWKRVLGENFFFFLKERMIWRFGGDVCGGW